MDIKQLIGDAMDYDKKLALEVKKPKSWCKSISAFANCYGGRLVFGVSDNDELVGLQDAESDAEKILADYQEQATFAKTRMPVFEADNDDFTLTLYNLNYGYTAEDVDIRRDAIDNSHADDVVTVGVEENSDKIKDDENQAKKMSGVMSED